MDAVNVLGNLTFQWIVVGVSEETMFRGLIQTYLMRNLEGSITIVGHEFHVGTWSGRFSGEASILSMC